jgi:hypothetical protein
VSTTSKFESKNNSVNREHPEESTIQSEFHPEEAGVKRQRGACAIERRRHLAPELVNFLSYSNAFSDMLIFEGLTFFLVWKDPEQDIKLFRRANPP